MKEYDTAIAECDKGIAISKEGAYDFIKLAKVLARKAAALSKKGSLDESLDTYKLALLENNDYWIKDSMKKVLKEKELTASKEYLDDEKSEEAKTRGNEFFKAGNFPDALKEFDDALKRNPNNIGVYANRASAYIKLMDGSRALSDAEKVIKLDEKYIKGWIRKAQA